VPTRSVPEGVAAVVEYSMSEPAERLIAAMTQAASGVCTGELTQAVRDATTPVGSIRQGDWLGLVGGEVQVIRRSVPVRLSGAWHWVLVLLLGRKRAQKIRERRISSLFAKALVDLLERVTTPGAEVATLITGIGAEERVTAAARRWFQQRRAGVEVDVIDGGQPLYPYLIGVE